MTIPQDRLRNFSIIAHIDHGKSTLADRLLEMTHTIEGRQMMSQVLDSMDLEREKGITIKARAVRLEYTARDGLVYGLNLIDTPGHVDFAYEVSHSLQACEGAILVVDATQGIEAQTLANVHLALRENLTLIPVLNKIDLPSADPETIMDELENVLAIPREEVILASAKDGTGVPEILEAIVARIPAPKGDPARPLKGLIFDSHYDAYKGVVVYVRLAEGTLRQGDAIRLMAQRRGGRPARARRLPAAARAGQAARRGRGRLRRDRAQERPRRPGRRHGHDRRPGPRTRRCPATRRPRASSSPASTRSAARTTRSCATRSRSCTSTTRASPTRPESSVALGFGFRCGFLGLLHMEIVQERLEREFALDLIASAPSVEYHVQLMHGRGTVVVDNPALLPEPGEIEAIEEPWVKLSVVTPTGYIGPLMELSTNRRGEFMTMEYLDPTRVVLHFEMPLAELIVDYFDQLKSRSQGYASMDYEELGYRPANLVKVDILVNGEPVDALSLIVHRDRAQSTGRALTERLKQLIPRQMFEIPIQAAIGSNVIAREIGAGDAQERPRQVLRWRHHPQAQAAREAEGRQAAHEAGRLGRDPAGGVPGDAPDGRGLGARAWTTSSSLARSLITVGLTLLLILLRLDAEKFGTAEYYEATRDGERPRVRRRLGWYGLGFALAIAILYIHPSPQARPLPRLRQSARRRPRRARLRPDRHRRRGHLRDLPLSPHPLPRGLVVPGGAAQLDGHRVHRRGGLPRRPASACSSWPASTRPWPTSSRRSSTRSRRGSGRPAATATCSS